MSKKDEQKKLPVYVRLVFWVGIVLGCAVVGVLAGKFLAPMWKNFSSGIKGVPVVGDYIASVKVGTAFLATIVGIVLSQFLGSLMRGIRRL